MKRLFLVLSAVLIFTGVSYAATIDVNTSMTDAAIISAIESAQAGDEVVIQPGSYSVRLYLANSGTATNPIVIRGADPANRPVFDYTGNFVPNFPGSQSSAWMSLYAINIQGGNHITIEDIIVTGARGPTGGGAGVYIGPLGTNREPAEPGTQPNNITLRRVEISDGDDGLASTGHNVLIDDCYIHGNGFFPSTASRHNTYIHGGSITFRNTRFANSAGHNIHTRAAMTIVENCDLGTFASPCQIQVLTPKADMVKGQAFTQTFIMRDSNISSDRKSTTGNPIRDMIEVVNGNNFSGLTQNVELYGNTYAGPGGISRAVWLNKTSGTVGMGLKTAQNDWSGIGSFLALASGENWGMSTYTIDVQDYSDASLPPDSGTDPVTPDPTATISIRATWDQQVVEGLEGWRLYAGPDQYNLTQVADIPYTDGQALVHEVSLTVETGEVFFALKAYGTGNRVTPYSELSSVMVSENPGNPDLPVIPTPTNLVIELL